MPERRLVQFDCGKLQVLARLLAERRAGGHRCLIFTQMSRMLDVLETFLNAHAYTYLRLDGSTGVDDRQRMMERFNRDERVFCFILSTRRCAVAVVLRVRGPSITARGGQWRSWHQSRGRGHRRVLRF